MKLTSTLLALAAAGLLALATAVPAGAIVPPRNCKTMKVEGKRYNVKADQLRCRAARRYTKRYLRTGSKPGAYKCERGDKGSRLAFRCVAARYDPDRTFFAIRR